MARDVAGNSLDFKRLFLLCSYPIPANPEHSMGNSRYPEPLTPAASREAPLDLNDPVEAQIAKVREIFDRVKLFPEQTTENWAHLIALRNTIPDLCTALWYANKKLKELHRGESAR